MQVYCGIDLVEIERIERAYSLRPQAFMKRIFTEREREELRLRPLKPATLAGRFAAKEAVAKALGSGIGYVSWKDIEVLGAAGGKPTVNLNGRARMLADKLGIREIALSISHARHYAVAQALAVNSKNLFSTPAGY